jgi:3-oxoacyl-[acyl-carrier protein] reductase
MDLGLRGRSVLVGGSSRGIGYAIARAFLIEGASVCITGRDEPALTAARKALDSLGRVVARPGDLLAPDAAADAVRAVHEAFGGLDVLVCNVGSGTGRAGWELTEDDWGALFEINFHASRRLAEAALPAMVAAGRGSVVFIGSIVGIESARAPITYSAAKAALVSYSNNLARHVARHGVRVNAVAPGNVLVDGGSWARKLADRPDQVRQFIDTEVPLGRFGTADEIASVVTFLASERAAFVTGACVVADGGQTRSY